MVFTNSPLPLSQRVDSDFQLIVTVDGKDVTTELGGKTCGGTCTFRVSFGMFNKIFIK